MFDFDLPKPNWIDCQTFWIISEIVVRVQENLTKELYTIINKLDFSHRHCNIHQIHKNQIEIQSHD